MDKLLQAIADAMKMSIEDDPDGRGQWYLSEDRKRLSITTRFSREPRMSNNGGDYYFYTIFTQDIDGIREREDTSCDIDFDWHFNNDVHPVSVDLVDVVKQAEAMLERK